MGLRVKDGGESESRLVMRRIGVALPIQQHYPTRKRADFHLVLRHEKADGSVETGIRRIGSSHVAAGASLRDPVDGSSLDRALSSA